MSKTTTSTLTPPHDEEKDQEFQALKLEVKQVHGTLDTIMKKLDALQLNQSQDKQPSTEPLLPTALLQQVSTGDVTLDQQMERKKLDLEWSELRQAQSDLILEQINLEQQQFAFDQHKLDLIKLLTLNQDQTQMIVDMSTDHFQQLYREYQLHNCQVDLGLNVSIPASVTSPGRPLSTPRTNTKEVLKQCHDNLRAWLGDRTPTKGNHKARTTGTGRRSPSAKVFFRLDNLEKHIVFPIHSQQPVLDLLYKTASSTWSWPIFGHYLVKDCQSGAVPALTDELKLFFSSRHIMGGEWIQFHGPGTPEALLFHEDNPQNFKLKLGHLLDVNSPGDFIGVNDWDHNKTARQQVAQYVVAIRWE